MLGLTMFGALALTGCEQISQLLNPEKSYTYNDFKALLADRSLEFFVTKCTSTIDNDGEKTTRDYTYDSQSKIWRYTYQQTVLGEKVTMNGTASLDIVNYVKKLDTAAALINKSVDSVYKFYASSDAYRITASYTDNKRIQIEGEYKFGSDGLFVSSYEKQTNLDSVTKTETTETFKYS